MSEKEPGQIASEAWQLCVAWENQHPDQQERWAEVETAVREDERRKVIKECAALMHDDLGYPSEKISALLDEKEKPQP